MERKEREKCWWGYENIVSSFCTIFQYSFDHSKVSNEWLKQNKRALGKKKILSSWKQILRLSWKILKFSFEDHDSRNIFTKPHVMKTFDDTIWNSKCSIIILKTFCNLVHLEVRNFSFKHLKVTYEHRIVCF